MRPWLILLAIACGLIAAFYAPSWYYEYRMRDCLRALAEAGIPPALATTKTACVKFVNGSGG